MTKKQMQILASVERIRRSFYVGSKDAYVSRTWTEILKLTGLSKSTLSIYVRKLLRQGIITAKPALDEKGRPRKVYRYTRHSFKIKGKKKPSLTPVARVFYDQEHNILGAKWGYHKRGKPTKKDTGKQRKEYYFVEDKNLGDSLPIKPQFRRTERRTHRHQNTNKG